MDRRTKVVERVKSLLIVLLACSAVLLASRTSLIRPLSDLLSPREDSGGANVYRVPVQRLEMARPVAMAALIPGEGRTLRYGVQYDTAACDALFQQGASLLVEALSSAGTPRRIGRQEWERALTQAPGLYFDFLGQLPLDVLAGWLSTPDCALTGTARRMALTVSDGQVLLCYHDTREEAYYACTAGVVNPDHLAQAVSGLSGNGAFFAFETEEYAALAPDTLLLPEEPQLPVYQSADPLSGEGGGLASLMDDLYFSRESTAFYSAGDEQVARSGGESLRLSRRGVLEYSCDAGSDSRYVIGAPGADPTLTEVGEYCRYLAQQTVGARCGQARLYLARAEQQGSALILEFEYCLNGAAVSLEGGSAASFQVENGRVVQFTLRFRSYAAGDQNTLLLPQRQAMAVLQQAGGSGRELRLVCVDQGGETAALQWAAGEGD